MLPDALPQLIETLLRLPHLDVAQLRELLQHLPDPHASAQEMLRRDWITPEQFSSLFPDPEQQPTPRETMPFGLPEETPPDADGEDWDLFVNDEEYPVDVPPEAEPVSLDPTEEGILLEPETDEAIPVFPASASTPQFECDALAPPVAGGNETRRRDSDPDRPPGRWRDRAGEGLLVGTLFLGTLVAALPYFGGTSTVQPLAQIDPVNTAKQRDDLPNSTGQNAPPAAPVVVPVAVPVVVLPAPPVAEPRVPEEIPAPVKVRPKATASLYDRVRQVVLENRTEETERLGIGDIAYQHVPEDGSIMVGMEVSYAPFFNHNLIKSVRPIYQRPDGERYDGPVCGTPTQVRERVVAREGYAIGGAAIKSGMGIDAVQLTFMEIGAEGLNPNKGYLSKWLGGHGGADTRMFVNDGRPIIGIAGMRSKDASGPAFCLCLVTTPRGTIVAADGPGDKMPRIEIVNLNEAAPFSVGQGVLVKWGGRWWDAQVLKAENGRWYITYSGFGAGWDEWVGPARIRRR